MARNGVEEIIRQVVAAHNRGDRTRARRLCAAALEASPDDPALAHLEAHLLFAAGDHAAALQAAGRSLERQPANVPLRLVAGRAARALGRFAEAAGHFRAIAHAMPEARLELARTLDMAGERTQARTAWAAVRTADPGSREAAARLGRLMWEDGRFEEARGLLEFAVGGEAPASAWFDLGLARQDAGDMDGAARAYAEALHRKPEDAEAAFNLAVALQETGRLAEAIDAYRRAYGLSQATLGMIANALASAPAGRMFLDRSALKTFLRG